LYDDISGYTVLTAKLFWPC